MFERRVVKERERVSLPEREGVREPGTANL